ncbi:MAG TPA: heterodisulfide reductase-related iron-sulfur binding cluster, partial [Rhizomicrobium sp.]|nr:heterodisulfide reductase-related iron-sulfur binding cluster [Rhizomicrobium sp.]
LKARAAVTNVPRVTAGKRVALMPGCVQQTLAPSIDAAIQRVLARRDMGTVKLEGCCGALSHHLGRTGEAKAHARAVIERFEAIGAVDAVSIGATGCSAHIADMPHLFAGDPVWEPRARAFAAKLRDFSSLAEPRAGSGKLRVAWQAPCSMQNSLGNAGAGRALLEAAGFDVADIPEGHLCCGSAGSYSLLQPEIAGALRSRKLANTRAIAPGVIATANIGCLIHLSGEDAPPIVHLAELIDWAEGGPKPAVLDQTRGAD